MMRVRVSPDMMANLRFAYSPLQELTISYRVLRGDWQRDLVSGLPNPTEKTDS